MGQLRHAVGGVNGSAWASLAVQLFREHRSQH